MAIRPADPPRSAFCRVPSEIHQYASDASARLLRDIAGALSCSSHSAQVRRMLICHLSAGLRVSLPLGIPGRVSKLWKIPGLEFSGLETRSRIVPIRHCQSLASRS